MISLAQRILTMPPALLTTYAGGGLDAKVGAALLARHAREIAFAPILRLNNVADFLAQKATETDIRRDIPNWSPPWKRFFAEWTAEALGNRCQFGAYVKTIDMLDNRDVDFIEREHIKLTDDARWLLQCFLWSSSPIAPINGKPCPSREVALVAVATDGSYLNGYAYPGLALMHVPISIIGLGISLTHCKNVVQKEEYEEIKPHVAKQHHLPPRLKYRILEINPMKKVLRTEGGLEANGLKKALHICRGHFATYSPNSPLFGKHVGTFWKPDHVRGKIERGAVVKDYTVSTS